MTSSALSDTSARLADLLELRSGAPTVAEPTGTVRDFLLFERGGASFALKAQQVEEVIAWRQPFPLPRADRRVMGIVQDRGRIIVVLSSFTGGDGAPPLRIIVCRTHRGHLGFCADSTRCVAAVRVHGHLTHDAVLDTSAGVVTFLDPELLVAASA